MLDPWTRIPIWLALVAYTVASGYLAIGRSGTGVRWIWTLGLFAYLFHVLEAFTLHHDWSHGEAWKSTAAQTRAMTGWNTGAGLYVNYAFTILWMGHALTWWMRPTFPQKTWQVCLSVAVQAAFLFMIFNGAIVFASGPVRWLGGLAMLAGGWRLRTTLGSLIGRSESVSRFDR